MEYKTVAESAKAIRAELKKLGYGPKDVSVRSKSYSGGSSINVKVLRKGVDFRAVEKAANAEEDVRRCPYTGDILSGGNRFVFVDPDHDLIESLARPLEASIAAMKDDEITIDGYTIRRFGCCDIIACKGDWTRQGTSPNEVAWGIAHHIVREG